MKNKIKFSKNQVILFTFFFMPLLAVSQKITVNGNVKSASEVLIGAVVFEKNTQNNTTTNRNGDYSITVNPNAMLVFSFVGYEKQEVSVNGRTNINVVLKDFLELEEVVVQGFSGVTGRARRRLESIQKIPESVVAYDAEAIETKGIVNIQTFSDQIPNVNYTNCQNIGNNFITVRGISHIRNGDSPIAFVIDGVTLPDANLINQELFDLALIEIIKGPQGAFYGRNAIAGAINIVTNEPTNTFKNKVSVGFGSGSLFRAQLATTGPVIKDKLFYRISGSFKKADGLLDNVTLKKPPDYIEDLSIRGQIKLIPSSTFEATLTGQIIDAEAGATYYAGPIKGTNFSPDDFDNQSIKGDQLGKSTLKGIYGNLRLKFELDNTTLTFSTTYNKGDRNHVGDLDMIALDITRQIQDSDSKTFNQEVRLSSKGDKALSWDLGAFYQSTDKTLYTKATADFGFFAAPPSPTGTQSTLATSDFTNSFSSIAVYGFVDYKVSEKFNIAAGLRFDNDKITQDNRTLKTKPSKTVSQLQPKLSLSYKPSEEALLFANYGRGYRSGGFNQDKTIRFEADYDAETTNNYEIGLKNSLWDDRLILNLSGYYIDFTNQQLYALLLDVANGNILIGNFNVPESESYGFEVDFKLRPSKYFDVIAAYGVSNSRILKGTSTVSTGNNEEINVSRKYTPLVPKNSFTLGLESKFDITEKISFTGNVNLEGTGKIYWHEDNAAYSSAYSLLNARLGLSYNDLSLTLWGTNILNKDYITEFFGQTFTNAGSDLVWQGQPASFGVDVSFEF